MRHFLVYTKDGRRYAVTAGSTRHAVAAIVARLGLTEQQSAQVVSWSVKDISRTSRDPSAGDVLIPAGGNTSSGGQA